MLMSILRANLMERVLVLLFDFLFFSAQHTVHLRITTGIDKTTAIALRMDDGTTAYALQHHFRDIKKTAQEMNEGTLSYHSPSFPEFLHSTTQHI